jgi:hypothetical protein
MSATKAKLTERQYQVLEFIKQYHRDNLRSPTFREIGAHFGMNNNGVACHIAALARKKAIVKLERSRGLIVREQADVDVVETIWGPFEIGIRRKASDSAEYRRMRYKENRLAMIEEMGGKCAHCEVDDPEILEFHHLQPRTWKTRDKNRWTRLAIYKREWAEGKIELLCAECNKAEGEPIAGDDAEGGDDQW